MTHPLKHNSPPLATQNKQSFQCVLSRSIYNNALWITDALPTGTFNDYDLSGGLNFSQTDEEGTYIEGDGSKSGNLVITKDGNNYTITIEPLYIISGEEDDDNTSNTTTTLTSLKYTGSIPKAPKKSWED